MLSNVIFLGMKLLVIRSSWGRTTHKDVIQSFKVTLERYSGVGNAIPATSEGSNMAPVAISVQSIDNQSSFSNFLLHGITSRLFPFLASIVEKIVQSLSHSGASHIQISGPFHHLFVGRLDCPSHDDTSLFRVNLGI
jgi:hypothetical protein